MSVAKITKEMFHCTCDHKDCAYEWDAEEVPQRCARCQRRTWNRPARLASKRLTFDGETLTILEWSRKLDLTRFAINWRLKQGWPIEQVLSKEDWRFQKAG